jgi:hypothetical protein
LRVKKGYKSPYLDSMVQYVSSTRQDSKKDLMVHEGSRHLLLINAEDPSQCTYLRNVKKQTLGGGEGELWYSHNRGWNQPCVKNWNYKLLQSLDPLGLEIVGQEKIYTTSKLRSFKLFEKYCLKNQKVFFFQFKRKKLLDLEPTILP